MNMVLIWEDAVRRSTSFIHVAEAAFRSPPMSVAAGVIVYGVLSWDVTSFAAY
jgi:hypothetical protein